MPNHHQAAPELSIKDSLEQALLQLPKPEAGHVRRYRNDNKGPLLSDIYVWQTVAKFAADKLKKAWTAAQAEGLIPADDELRSQGTGQHIIAESRGFSATAEVKNPPKQFNADTFLALLSRRYHIELSTLKGLLEQSKIDGTAPLSKRVLEAE